MTMQLLDPNGNRCPKCGGNLIIGDDECGSFTKCLMCSRTTCLVSRVSPMPSLRTNAFMAAWPSGR